MEKSSLNQLLHKYSFVFEEGLGTLNDFKAKLHTANKACSNPYAIHSLVNIEVDCLVEQNVIEPVSISDWATPIVLMMKMEGSSVRMCGDFKLTINPVRSLGICHLITKVEDFFSIIIIIQLFGGKAFTKLDLHKPTNNLS